MYFKISNTASKDLLEQWSGASFKYPLLYKPRIIINGLNEVSIPIITMEEKDMITLAIWGMLPEKYKDEWNIFQNSTNTLNLHEQFMESGLWYSEPLSTRRSVIPATGFFTSYLRNGEMYPYYVTLNSGKPFYLASIYNRLEDGFNTCSILVGKANKFIQKFQNVVDCMPLTVSEYDKSEWLDTGTSIERIKQLLKTPTDEVFQAHPIAKELFNNDISYDSMLLPFEYNKTNHR